MIIRKIADSTGLDYKYIATVIRSANHRYKTYTISKRGNKGRRKIDHPASELKLIQRWLITNIFQFFPVHDAVYSYKKGVGIQDLANLHRKNRFLLRIDFSNFFPSIKDNDVAHLLHNNKNLSEIKLFESDIPIINKIVCKDGKLTIGSPTSPMISNSILFDLDVAWRNEAAKNEIIYSRYADDIYASTNTPEILYDYFNFCKNYIKNSEYPKLCLNEKKTLFTSKKRKRMVTGLILTSENKISIGRKQKRYIKGLVYKYMEKMLSPHEISYLTGYLSYVSSVEPAFISSLKNKYGQDLLSKLLMEKITRRKH